MSINIYELYDILEAMPASQNLILVGKHGVGKSETLTRYFEQKGISVNILPPFSKSPAIPMLLPVFLPILWKCMIPSCNLFKIYKIWIFNVLYEMR
jgi:hypothetical protein